MAMAAAAPVPMSMTDDFRVDGYYVNDKSCAGCHEGPIQFSPDKTTATWGPYKRWKCCTCPAERLTNQPPGSMNYVGTSFTATWVGPGRFNNVRLESPTMHATIYQSITHTNSFTIASPLSPHAEAKQPRLQHQERKLSS